MPNQIDIPAIMDITEASAAVCLHHTTLRKAIKEGRLRASRPDGRAIRITREQLLAWLNPSTTAKKTRHVHSVVEDGISIGGGESRSWQVCSCGGRRETTEVWGERGTAVRTEGDWVLPEPKAKSKKEGAK